jgi:hypothetical protein
MRYATNDLEPHWLPFTANKAFKIIRSVLGKY